MNVQPSEYIGSDEKRMVTQQRQKKSSHSSEYISEFTEFIDGFLTEHPEVIADQHQGWKIFWDKKVDFDEMAHIKQATVPAKPYVYD
jgi:hypothetical protein